MCVCFGKIIFPERIIKQQDIRITSKDRVYIARKITQKARNNRFPKINNINVVYAQH